VCIARCRSAVAAGRFRREQCVGDGLAWFLLFFFADLLTFLIFILPSEQVTSKSAADIIKYVKEAENSDSLVVKTPSNPFVQNKSAGGGCC